MDENSTPLSPILASQSRARYHMLRSAGLDFSVQAPLIDEVALQQKLHEAMTPPESMAAALAAAKALSVAARHPAHYVIGADQVLYCNGRIFSKAPDAATAREHLQYLSGKQHQLISAVCIMQRDKVIWHYADRAKLTMRNLSAKDIDRYCAVAGDALTRSVGAYELEGMGAWLFDKIEGDHFTILGMPLFPLLGALRERGYGP